MTTNTDQKLDEILNAIKNLDARIIRMESNSAGTSAALKTAATEGTCKALSIKEFLIEKPPTTDIQRTLAIGYFLETNNQMPSFTKADLEKGYSDAKEALPSNISVNVNHCIKQGHMMEARDKKNNKTAYVVTRSGEQFVVAGFAKSKGGK